MKIKFLFGFVLLFIAISGLAFRSNLGNQDFEVAKQELFFREIGHQILLHAGDSTSRVLPVKKISGNEYVITFENEFTFQSDSLVSIIGNVLKKGNFSQNYIVNVLKCGSKHVYYGYAIFGDKKDDIIACKGRKQPKSCYLINIKFQDPILSTTQKNYLLGSLPLIACISLLIFSSVKSNKFKLIKNGLRNPIMLSNTIFDVDRRQLLFQDTTIELTTKESRILFIFAQSLNAVVERNRLQKEIWEDEGVIVSRSLDVFISKLRKKLENDPGVELLNIHGKGYKLVIRES